MARTKKEFSKEAMYKKIMPSMLRNNDDNLEKKSLSNIDIDIEEVDNLNAKDIKIIEDNIEICDKENDSIYTEQIANDTSQLNVEVKISEEIEEKLTVNLVEVLVIDKLESVLKRFKCCNCEECKNDIKIMALNNLPVHYFSGYKAEIDDEIKNFKLNNNIDVVTELIKAIILIRKKEKH